MQKLLGIMSVLGEKMALCVVFLCFFAILGEKSDVLAGFSVDASVSDEAVSLDFGGSTTKYYQVWASGTLTGEWTQVRGMALGENGVQRWEDATAVQEFSSLYYRLREIALDDPDDYDGDGIDDVYELRHGFLSPLYAGDGAQDYDGDSVNNLLEYYLGTNPDDVSDVPDIHPGDSDGDGVPDVYELLKGCDADDFGECPDADWFVNAAAEAGGDGSWEEPFNTIQDALDVASNFDVIEVADGVYRGEGNRELDYLGKTMLVRSTNGAAKCVIDCQGEARGIYLHSGESSLCVLMGVSILNGYAADGGAVFCEDAGITLQRCVLLNCSATYGGAVCSVGSEVQLRRTEICGNEAYAGGAVFCSTVSDLTVSRCKIIKNAADVCGGGIYCAE